MHNRARTHTHTYMSVCTVNIPKYAYIFDLIF
jgi:hypothetical protein